MFYKLNTLDDFEFYYLVELTRQKVKPFSRWEKAGNYELRCWLRRQGLFAEIIPRRTVLKRTVYETIFSTSSHYIDFYSRKFSNMAIRHDANTQQLEGFLFGYPSCCVRQFAQIPYQPNGLPRKDQALLFHWACRHCQTTSSLLPYYKSIHAQVSSWHKDAAPQNRLADKTGASHYRRKLQTALAAVLLSAGFLSAQSTPDTTHYIPLPNDINNNGLSYAEEIYLGAYDLGTLEDCRVWAEVFYKIIDGLPDTVHTDRAYKVECMMRGLVRCPKCGKDINMGYVTLVNPLRDLTMDIPYLGLHFMENGYFSFGDNQDFQRVDIDCLKRILYPFDARHLLPVNGDSDEDGLTDAEEDSLWQNDARNIKDFDGDGVPDGPQLAEDLIRMFPKLKETQDNVHSTVALRPVWGLENCKICGSTHNMGYIELTNPENKRSYQIPYLALHAMAHGSFAYDGTVHPNGHVEAFELYRSMKTHMVILSDDADNDGLKDDEETEFDLDPRNPDSDGNGICDGMDLALAYADSIKSLPTEPRNDGPYVEYLGMDGVHICPICGQEIVMGVRRIFNPLINTVDPLEVTNYAFHFLKKGSFGFEGALDGRISPKALRNYLGEVLVTIDPGQTTKKPASFVLEQNYPNPFNPETTISYHLSNKAGIRLTVYNIHGQEVKLLVDAVQSAGQQTVVWNGTDNANRLVSSGIYIYELHSGQWTQSRRMLLLR